MVAVAQFAQNRTIVAGINDVATTHSQYVQYFKDREDAKRYSVRGTAKTWFQCPLCGHEKYTTIDQAFAYGHYACKFCGDGISYGNKFVHHFLKQLSPEESLHIQAEKVFDWSKHVAPDGARRIYDFYIDGQEPIIIEVHGNQHYERAMGNGSTFRSLEEEQANDLLKYELAISNGINSKNYIVLDCRKSQKNYIINSIMHSVLPQILHFSENDVDWDACDQFATSSMVKMASDLWVSGIHRLSDIAEKIGCSVGAVSNYLRKADELGWIVYESIQNKPVVCLDNNYVFPNLNTCSALSESLFGVYLSAKGISGNVRGESRSTRGFHFAYLSRETFRQIKSISPHRVFE